MPGRKADFLDKFAKELRQLGEESRQQAAQALVTEVEDLLSSPTRPAADRAKFRAALSALVSKHKHGG